MFDVVSPFGAANFVATVAVTNTGSSLSGRQITVGYPSQISVVTESAGTWTWNGSTLTGVSSGALATGDLVHVVIVRPVPSGDTIHQPTIALDGVACTP